MRVEFNVISLNMMSLLQLTLSKSRQFYKVTYLFSSLNLTPVFETLPFFRLFVRHFVFLPSDS